MIDASCMSPFLFMIVWLFGIASGLLIAAQIAIFGPLFYKLMFPERGKSK